MEIFFYELEDALPGPVLVLSKMIKDFMKCLGKICSSSEEHYHLG
jgi:hypothetical protein